MMIRLINTRLLSPVVRMLEQDVRYEIKPMIQIAKVAARSYREISVKKSEYKEKNQANCIKNHWLKDSLPQAPNLCLWVKQTKVSHFGVNQMDRQFSTKQPKNENNERYIFANVDTDYFPRCILSRPQLHPLSFFEQSIQSVGESNPKGTDESGRLKTDNVELKQEALQSSRTERITDSAPEAKEARRTEGHEASEEVLLIANQITKTLHYADS
ncbi:hypothetical protein O181_001556 [Austropuccinia psidii MF-1]|uniref:Uncharacterized protein n=1 Tax=Austropuccinia psidii MF-1 TaxID=1389203 RepID=A0A9Q3BB76_9BASI|nr:hypothetical protein [Austropuccinia psidii MF-1]